MADRTPYIAANWKMHKTIAEAAEIVDALLPRIAATQSDVVVCPPFTALTAVVERRYGTAVKVAAPGPSLCTSTRASTESMLSLAPWGR